MSITLTALSLGLPALATEYTLDPETSGSAAAGILVFMPVGLSTKQDHFVLNVWLRNGWDRPLSIDPSALLCQRGERLYEAEIAGSQGPFLLVPEEAVRVQISCPHERSEPKRFGIFLPEVRSETAALLREVSFRFGPDTRGTVSFRRPPPEGVSLVPPKPVRVVVPVGDPQALAAMGFEPWGDETGKFAHGRYTPGPNLGEWLLRPGSGPAADVWFGGAQKGFRIEVSVRVTAAEPHWGGRSCAGLWIHDGGTKHDLHFEPGVVWLDGASTPWDTSKLATWTVETVGQELLLSRDGTALLSVPRSGGSSATVALNFGHLGNCDVSSEWVSLSFEANLGIPRWSPPKRPPPLGGYWPYEEEWVYPRGPDER